MEDFTFFTAHPLGILLIAVAAAVIAGLILALLARIPKLRGPINKGVRAAWNFVRSIRISVTTTTRRAAALAAAEERGRAEVEERVAADRSAAPIPTWTVTASDADDRFTLRSTPGRSTDVVVTAPATHFVLDGHNAWSEVGVDSDGSYVGKTIGGIVTDRGRAEGVPFKVAWKDRNGDPHEAEAFLPAEAIAPLTTAESLEEAFERGVQEEREKVVAERAAPVYPPRWNAVRDRTGGRTDFVLTNSADQSVAKHVVLQHPAGSDLRFISGAAWDDLSGKNAAVFEALVTDEGWAFGVQVWVYWTGSDGKRRDELLPIGGTGQH
ncbi:hypothetical protein A4X17_05975 [Plantibacter sp. H53]|uniref:hypothetical protein n=1 Tax=Plantibacter sp. H53 TaxID=1827323 RepID=UPI0007D8E196|nr:hypothetical protein [Plantibacter sp. H53]OAN29121.1 hypothetical protein A4X17_05975 [Plantibacter sp. H53]